MKNMPAVAINPIAWNTNSSRFFIAAKSATAPRGGAVSATIVRAMVVAMLNLKVASLGSSPLAATSAK